MLQWSVGGVLLVISHTLVFDPVGGWIDHWVCDAWPVWHQTYGFLPSRRASPPFGRYQIILLGHRGTWVWTTCPWELLYPAIHRPGVKPATFRSQVQCPTTTLPSHDRSDVNQCIKNMYAIAYLDGNFTFTFTNACYFQVKIRVYKRLLFFHNVHYIYGIILWM